MNLREKEDEDSTKVHDIKFDEYGIMDDGIDETTNEQLAKLNTNKGISYLVIFLYRDIHLIICWGSIKTFVTFISHLKGKSLTNGTTEDGAVGGASVTGPIDEDLFDDEDLDELEEDLENLEVW